MTVWVNEKPFEHRCRNGTVFTGTRCDLRDGVDVQLDGWVKDVRGWRELVNCDYVEFAAWHALNIFPQLNGFQGYDCITFRNTTEHV